MLAVVVVLLMLFEAMPKSDRQFPLAGRYILATMCTMLVATLVEVGVMLHENGNGF